MNNPALSPLRLVTMVAVTLFAFAANSILCRVLFLGEVFTLHLTLCSLAILGGIGLTIAFRQRKL